MESGMELLRVLRLCNNSHPLTCAVPTKRNYCRDICRMALSTVFVISLLISSLLPGTSASPTQITEQCITTLQRNCFEEDAALRSAVADKDRDRICKATSGILLCVACVDLSCVLNLKTVFTQYAEEPHNCRLTRQDILIIQGVTETWVSKCAPYNIVDPTEDTPPNRSTSRYTGNPDDPSDDSTGSRICISPALLLAAITWALLKVL